MVDTALLVTAGYGTRMYPLSRVIPKELLPIFIRIGDSVKPIPILQFIIYLMYRSGVREYYIVTNARKARLIKTLLSRDIPYTDILWGIGKYELVEDILEFGRILDDINTTIIFQDRPLGFGDAISRADRYIDKPFILSACDDLIIDTITPFKSIKRLIDTFKSYNVDGVFYTLKVGDPRQYGIIEVSEVSKGLYRVNKIIEKPKIPTSNLIIIALYVFKPIIFEVMNILKSTRGIYWEHTDTMQYMIDLGYRIYALEKSENEVRIDFGRPEAYLESINGVLKVTYTASNF